MTTVLLLLSFWQAPDLPTRLDEQVRAYVEQKQFNGSVLVARDGKILLRKGYGLANAEWNIPNAPDTRFRLGSITKQFTAMGIMLLERQGKLKVSDPVCQYVERCPESWKPITIHHLLTHTSGIPNFTNFPDYASTMALASPASETLRRFLDKPLDFDPGTKYRYSNSGYVLLGYVLEKASGAKYDEYLRQNIFDPLGMKDTGYDWNWEVVPRRASGYDREGGQLRNTSYIHMTVPGAAGALYSTVDDMYKWDQALYTEKLLPKEAMERYFKPFIDGYAYGWMNRKIGGMNSVGHGGGINGFSTMIDRVPELRLVVIALDNILPAKTGNVSGDLVRLAAGQTVGLPGARKEVTVAPAILQQYVGDYVISPSFKLMVTLEGGQLQTQATGQSKVPIFAESETRFFPKVVDATLIFEKDKDGKVTGLTLEQGGGSTKAARQ